jgi:hypothetical protein
LAHELARIWGVGIALWFGFVLPRRYWENAMMTRSMQVGVALWRQERCCYRPAAFVWRKIYPILENAGCRNCHNVEGVASATRLHFPIEGADKARVDAFGKSLAEFVDRQNPANSLLFLKPTYAYSTPVASASVKVVRRK